MQRISDRFKAALLDNQQIATRFELWSGPGGKLLQTLNVSAGQVSEDVANAVRRQTKMAIDDPGGVLLAGTRLRPFGNEIRPYRGLTFEDGSTELVPLGVYGITDRVVTDGPDDFTILLTGSDRAELVARNRLRDFYPIPAGTDLGTAIKALIVHQVPVLNDASFFKFTATTGQVTPLVALQPGADPWAESQTLATAAGYDLWWDEIGVCNLAVTPDPTQTASSWTYVDDKATSMMASLSTALTNRSVYNHIIATSSGTGIPTPLRAEAWDANPSSPTFIGYNYGTPGWVPSAYGDVINVINVTTATTQAQLLAAAGAALRQALGLSQQVTLNAIVNPAHLANDVVTLTRARSQLNALQVVMDTVTIPFGPDGQLSTVMRTVI